MTDRSEHAQGAVHEPVFIDGHAMAATEDAKAMTRRRVASETDVGAPVVHESDGDKTTPLDSILVNAFHRLATEMQRARGDDPSQGPREVLHAYLNFAAANSSVFLLAHGLSGVDVSAATRLDAARAAAAVMVDALQQRPSVGLDARAEEVSSQAEALWSVATGLALTASAQPGGFDRAHALADHALESLLRTWDGPKRWS